MGIIFAILLLVGGYYFLKNYERIDRFVCEEENSSYEQFGLWPVFTCTFLGAINGCLFVWKEVIHRSAEIGPEVTATIYTLAIMTCAIGIYETFFRLTDPATIGKKVILLLFSCAFGMLVGAFASVVVICLLLFALLAMLFGKVSMDSLKSTGKSRRSGTLYGNDGSYRELEDISGGSGMTYRDDRGEEWEHQPGGSLKNTKTGERIYTWNKENK